MNTAVFGDRLAKYRPYELIERIADKARSLGRIDGHSRFNIVDYVEGPLKYCINCELEIITYDKSEYPVWAFVKYCKNNKIELHVEKMVWRNAKAGFADAKYIIAHEIGYILMHTHDELAYSDGHKSNISGFPPEERNESQANLFADLFLLPTRFLEGFTSSEDVEFYFEVPAHCAARRLEFFLDIKRRALSRSYTGEACPECANFTLVRNGTCLKCDTCGSTTGCS